MALQAAKVYYDQLLHGDYAAFVDGMNMNDTVVPAYREQLITNMMRWSEVTEAELEERREIPTDIGETLSWDYLCYVRRHPIRWSVPTCILYGQRDGLTPYETISAFAKVIHAPLTVMEGGEHWFHTSEQMAFLDRWVVESMACLSGGETQTADTATLPGLL